MVSTSVRRRRAFRGLPSPRGRTSVSTSGRLARRSMLSPISGTGFSAARGFHPPPTVTNRRPADLSTSRRCRTRPGGSPTTDARRTRYDRSNRSVRPVRVRRSSTPANGDRSPIGLLVDRFPKSDVRRAGSRRTPNCPERSFSTVNPNPPRAGETGYPSRFEPFRELRQGCFVRSDFNVPSVWEVRFG